MNRAFSARLCVGHAETQGVAPWAGMNDALGVGELAIGNDREYSGIGTLELELELERWSWHFLEETMIVRHGYFVWVQSPSC